MEMRCKDITSDLYTDNNSFVKLESFWLRENSNIEKYFCTNLYFPFNWRNVYNTESKIYYTMNSCYWRLNEKLANGIFYNQKFQKLNKLFLELERVWEKKLTTYFYINKIYMAIYMNKTDIIFESFF